MPGATKTTTVIHDATTDVTSTSIKNSNMITTKSESHIDLSDGKYIHNYYHDNIGLRENPAGQWHYNESQRGVYDVGEGQETIHLIEIHNDNIEQKVSVVQNDEGTFVHHSHENAVGASFVG